MSDDPVKPKTWQEAYSEEHSEFHKWIGWGISEWGYVDERLFEIFEWCLRTDRLIAAILYYRTSGLEVRANTVEEVLLAVLPKKTRPDGGKDHPLVAQWKAIRAKMSDLLQIRNVIAHQRAKGAIYGLADEAAPDEIWSANAFVLFQISTTDAENTRDAERKKKAKQPLGLADLKEHAQLVTALANDLTAYAYALSKHKR